MTSPVAGPPQPPASALAADCRELSVWLGQLFSTAARFWTGTYDIELDTDERTIHIVAADDGETRRWHTVLKTTSLGLHVTVTTENGNPVVLGRPDSPHGYRIRVTSLEAQ